MHQITNGESVNCLPRPALELLKVGYWRFFIVNAVVHNYFQVFAYHSPERKRSCRFCLPTRSSFRTMVLVVRTDEADYGTLGVIYLTPESEASSELAVQWNQGSIAKNSNYGPFRNYQLGNLRYTTSRVG